MVPVFIGMPVFNGAKHIRSTLDSVLKQDYQNWSLFISDNNSDDDTSVIAQEYANLDSRIRYFKQRVNVGPHGNFEYVLNQSDCEYFVWLAADDIWLPNFLTTCTNSISRNGEVGLSFTNLKAIDDKDIIVRDCPTLPSLSGKRSLRTVLKYVFEPEISGKANLIYGVCRTSIAKNAWEKTVSGKCYWGQDMCFVLAMICQCDVHVDKSICFYKRYSLPVCPEESEQTSNYSKNPYIPFAEFYSYFKGTLHATSKTNYFWPIFAIMGIRLILNFINRLLK